MRMTNDSLVNISILKRSNTSAETLIESLGKDTTIAEYESTSKLDDQHPDFEKMKEKAEKNLEFIKKNNEAQIEKLKKVIENNNEGIKKEEDRIERIEKGELKISLDNLNSKTSLILSSKENEDLDEFDEDEDEDEDEDQD